MNSENDDTDDTNDDIPWFETEAAAFIGAAAAGKAAGLPARVVQRIRSIWRTPTQPRSPWAWAICPLR
jgi:hypothetical protein